MNDHDDPRDHEALERRVRASLRARSEDVQPTPALYRRVRREVGRAARRPVWLSLGAAAAAVLATVLVVTNLPQDLPRIDIAETPSTTGTDASPGASDSGPADPAPTTGDQAAPGIVDPVLATALVDAGLAFADAETVTIRDRTVRVDPAGGGVVALAARVDLENDDDAVAVAAFADGGLGVVDLLAGSSASFDVLVEGTPNGGGIAFSPDGRAIGWIEGTDLHVLPLRSGPEALRVIPLEGDVPADLVLEDWFEQADAQVIVASDGDGLWSIPMDVGSALQTAPTDPAFRLAGAPGVADDGLLLPSLAVFSVREADPGTGGSATASYAVDGSEQQLPVLGDAQQLAVSGDDDGAFALLDAETGRGLLAVAGDTGEGVAFPRSFADPSLRAVVALAVPDAVRAATGPPTDLVTGAAAGATGGAATGDDVDAVDLGLAADHLVIGTDGVSLVVVDPATGDERRLELYPAAESEATLGEIAVRPGSSPTDAAIAYESSSEGETSIRFATLADTTVELTGPIVVTAGDVTGLAWDEDGQALAWSDDAGTHVLGLDPGDVVDPTTREVLDDAGLLVTTDAGSVVDWHWTDQLADGVGGHVSLAVDLDAGGVGVVLHEVVREGDGTLAVGDTEMGGSDRVVLDSHANPRAAVGPEFLVAVEGGDAVVEYAADGDRFGRLASVGMIGPSDGTSHAASGGVVVVVGERRQVVVTTDGVLRELPAAADWDVID